MKYEKYKKKDGEKKGRYFRLTWDFESEDDLKGKEKILNSQRIFGTKNLKRILEESLPNPDQIKELEK